MTRTFAMVRHALLGATVAALLAVVGCENTAAPRSTPADGGVAAGSRQPAQPQQAADADRPQLPAMQEPAKQRAEVLHLADGIQSPDYVRAPHFDLDSVLGRTRLLTPAEGRAYELPAAGAHAAGHDPTELDPRALAALSPGDELWIIIPPDADSPPPDDDTLGCGALVCPPLDGHEQFVPVPLEHTDVNASISGYVASVNVTQRFHNPFDTKIEAVYVFPLPDNAAVNGFLMTVGERTIRGVIRKREEAQQIYQAARNAGHHAAILEQQRPNIFTQKVANLEPGARIDVDITYFHTLAYADGWFEYVFPMVVGPRFNPPSTLASGEGVVAMPRGVQSTSGQQTEVQYLRPGERSGHDISLAVALDAGVEVEEIRSASHEVRARQQSASRWTVELAAHDTIPNKDFVLRYRVAGEELKQGLLVQRDDDGGGWFTMLLIPPASLQDLQRAPVEFVFVIDCSGSMRGRPLEQAKAAVRASLDRIQPGDSFQIIRFADSASSMGAAPLEATPENIRRGRRYLDSLTANGGTMMINGIKAALDFPHDPDRTRYVTFMTDGYIGNEREILAAMLERIGPSRVFSFGVGSATNRYLIERMAAVGRGAVAYVGLNDDAAEVMGAFFDRVSHPALTDVEIDFGPLRATDVYPRRVPDLFVGRPAILTGRFEGDPAALQSEPIRVHGRSGNRPTDIDVHWPAAADDAAGLDAVWARSRIRELSALALAGDPRGEYRDMIEHTALNHELMSAFTSFVAVDSLSRTAGDHGVTVAVPVPVPEGVRYETTVSGGGS